jgi:hypothetical protein
MKKDLTTLLQKGELTPKERVLLLAHNVINLEKTGKEILSEQDVNAISKGWKPANNREVQEYNKYIELWKIYPFAEIDAQSCYYRAVIALNNLKGFVLFLTNLPWVDALKDTVNYLKGIKHATPDEIIKIAKLQSEAKLAEGKSVDYVIHRYFFDSLDNKTKDKLLEYDESAKTEPYWLDEEIEIEGYYKTKNYEAIAEEISYFDTLLTHAYACIPIKEIARRYLYENGVETPPDIKIMDLEPIVDRYVK